jgi:hypothetical protein
MLILALLLAAVTATASPCPDCAQPGDPVTERDRHDLLFYGTVFAARDSTLPRSGNGPAPYIHLVGIRPKGVWKGQPSKELLLVLDPCATRKVDPQPGETWVIYADSVKGVPTIPPCTRSALREGNDDEFVALGQPKSLVVPRAKRPTPH